MTITISLRRHHIEMVMAMLLLSVYLVACDPTNQQQAQNKAQLIAQNRSPYVMKNDIEFKNYDKRQQIADDPTTILWCTSAFPIPSSPLFTVPIVGKLTSGNKRPFPTSQVVQSDTTTTYNPELPGPDGMYGASGEYRYGFTPGNVYSDWYNLGTFCTTEPMVWQREATTIVMQSDPTLLDAQKRAQEALQRGQPDQANQILTEAINKVKGR